MINWPLIAEQLV